MWLMGDTLQTEKNIQTEGVVVEKVIIFLCFVTSYLVHF